MVKYFGRLQTPARGKRRDEEESIGGRTREKVYEKGPHAQPETLRPRPTEESKGRCKGGRGLMGNNDVDYFLKYQYRVYCRIKNEGEGGLKIDLKREMRRRSQKSACWGAGRRNRVRRKDSRDGLS